MAERRRLAGAAGLAVLGAAGLAIHAWFAVASDALNTDQALVPLMARHFAQGELSIFFWQQNYMAALEPLLLTPLALVGWATPVASGFVGIALTATLAALSVGLARRLGGSPWMALLLWAVAPAVVVHHHVALYGARLAATLLAVAAFAWSLRARAPRGWVGVGALVGLAYFGDHFMLTWAAAVMFVAARRGGLKHFALGALPLVVVDTVAAVMTPAIHISGPNDPGDWIRNVPLLFGTTLPQLFGLLLSRGPSPAYEAPASVIPGGLLWPVLAIPGAAALALLLATLVRHRHELFGKDAPDEGVACRALLLACLVGLGLFGLVGGGGDTWSARYLVPLWPAYSVFAAVAAARWRPRIRPLAAAVVLPAVFTLLADGTWPKGGDGGPAREEASAVGRAVRAAGAQAVWAEYWDSYRLALLVGESPPWLTLRGIERRPDWVQRAREASPVAYLVRHGNAEILGLLKGDGAQGIRRIADREVGRYRLVVMERSVPGVVVKSPPPPRGLQMLAALSAGLLFAGAVVAVGLLAWVTPHGSNEEPR
ncbi:MAG: hypothetical protein Q8N53_08805 [Longimicrobiales bacterium]|nr:hypothetical protein [Longimicrobiales bacterium]